MRMMHPEEKSGDRTFIIRPYVEYSSTRRTTYEKSAATS